MKVSEVDWLELNMCSCTLFLARAVGVAVGRRSCIQRLHYPAFAAFFFICLFELVHLNGLIFDEWVDHVVKELNFVVALFLS